MLMPTRNHEITAGEMHSLTEDENGDPQHWIETWLKCSCGWEDGTWCSDIVDPVILREGDDSISFVRRLRDFAVDRHIFETHRFSSSSYSAETV